MNNREHLTLQGLEIILSIKASLNLGLYDELKAAFPKIEPILKKKFFFFVVNKKNSASGLNSGIYLVEMEVSILL